MLASYFLERTLRRQLVLGDAKHHDALVAHGNGRAVLSLLQHLVAERRSDHLAIRIERCAALPREPVRRAELHSQLARNRVEFAETCKRLVRELLRSFVEHRLRPVLPVIRLELAAHCLEALLVRRVDLVEANDVIAELRLHRTADLALFHAEQRVRKRPDEALPRCPAKVAALCLRSGIIRVLGRKAREVLARADASGERIGLCARGVIVRSGLHQDVPAPPAFGGDVAFGRHLVVVLPQRLVGHVDARRDVGQVEPHILQVDALRRLVVSLVLLVPVRHVRGRDRDFVGKTGCRYDRHVHFADFALDRHAAAQLSRQCEGRDADRVAQLRNLEIAPELLLEVRLRAALRTEQRGIAITREPSVHLQGRQCRQGLRELTVADAITQFVGALQ